MLPVSAPLDVYMGGSTEIWTVDVLCALVKALRPGLVIETGTYEGLTTRRLYEAMGTLQQSSRLITVECDPERRARASEWVATWQENYVAVEVWETDALNALKQFNDNSVDFIFLDDDHAAMHVADELREVQRILRPGGVCTSHDVIGPYGLDAVFRAIGGISLPFVRLHAGGGLGIWVK